MREFQDWTRDEIRRRFAELDERKRFLNSRIAEFETMPINIDDMLERMPFDSPSIRESVIDIRRSTLISGARQEHIQCSKEQQALNLEIRIRDSPELTAELGPGRD